MPLKDTKEAPKEPAKELPKTYAKIEEQLEAEGFKPVKDRPDHYMKNGKLCRINATRNAVITL